MRTLAPLPGVEPGRQAGSYPAPAVWSALVPRGLGLLFRLLRLKCAFPPTGPTRGGRTDPEGPSVPVGRTLGPPDPLTGHRRTIPAATVCQPDDRKPDSREPDGREPDARTPDGPKPDGR